HTPPSESQNHLSARRPELLFQRTRGLRSALLEFAARGVPPCGLRRSAQLRRRNAPSALSIRSGARGNSSKRRRTRRVQGPDEISPGFRTNNRADLAADLLRDWHAPG